MVSQKTLPLDGNAIHLWNSKANRAKGTTEAVKILNSCLETLVTKVSTVHAVMVAAAEEITAESIKLRFQGKQFLDVFREHNMQMEALLGNGFKPNIETGNHLAFG